MMVKICGITNEEDARIAVEAGARALGFNFYESSPRFISFEAAQTIVRRVRGDYLKVGVFVNAAETLLATAAHQVPLDIVQLHGSAAPCSIPRWRAIRPQGALEEESGYEAYLIDTPSENFGGSGRTFDWSLARAFQKRKIIAGGLDAANVAEAIRSTLPWGVDACSRLEGSPGKKDPTRVRAFVAAALLAAQG